MNKTSKLLSSLLCLLVFLSFLILPESAIAADRKDSVSVGVLGFVAGGASGSVQFVEYERRIIRVIAVYAAFEHMSYDYSHGSYYVEKGQGPGGEVGVRLYPFERRDLRDLYFGAGISRWSVEANWKDEVGTPFVMGKSFRTEIVSLAFQTGYKWYIVKHRLYVDPRLILGKTDGNNGSGEGIAFRHSAGVMIAAGVAVGINW